jgi:hypothetical protein
MNKYPKYVETNGKQFEINTDFRIALECSEISRNQAIGDNEKCLAIIYKLFGEKGLEDHENRYKLFTLAIKYLKCGETTSDDTTNDKEPSMDFEQDEGYIKASFMSDYGIDLDKANLHWWQFNDLLKGLTEDCILNRVRYIREEPLTDKKGKELEKWKEMKKQVELRHVKTKEEKDLDDQWAKVMRKDDEK